MSEILTDAQRLLEYEPGMKAQEEASPNPVFAKAVTGRALLEVPEPEPLVSGLLFYESTSMLVGAPKSGKSFLAIDLAGSVITGRDWQGSKVHPKSGRVLYLAGEGRRGIMRRFTAWANKHAEGLGTTGPKLLERLCEGLTVIPGGLRLQEDHDRGFLIDGATESEWDLVIIDTLARHFRGGEENSARDVGRYVGAVEQLALETGAHIMSPHHLGKAGAASGARGSSALLGAVDTELTITGTPKTGVTVKVTAQKDEEEAASWFVAFDTVETPTDRHPLATSLVAIAKASPPVVTTETHEALLSSLKAQKVATTKQWQEDYDEQQGTETIRGTFSRWVGQLEDANRIENIGTEKVAKWKIRPASEQLEL